MSLNIIIYLIMSQFHGYIIYFSLFIHMVIYLIMSYLSM